MTTPTESIYVATIGSALQESLTSLFGELATESPGIEVMNEEPALWSEAATVEPADEVFVSRVSCTAAV